MNLKHGFYRVYQSVYKVAMGALDWTPPELLQGAGAIKKLPALVKKQGVNNVLVVTDKGLMGLHLLDSLFEGLESEGIKYTVFDGVQPNPTIYNVEDALKLYHDNGCEAFIAFGGGSPMDCAKVTAAKVARPNKSIPSMRGQLKVLKKTPLIFAVPTTAGTGSETTLAAVISNPDTHEKNAINDPVLRPKFAVLDPELTVGLPPHITSTTGMDALTHAVEAFIGRSNVKSTEDAALKATKLIFENIEKVYEDGKNIEARENMLIASFYAGVAFTRAYVGYVHAIAHNLGGMYGIPHGLANAVILPYILEFFGDSAHHRLAILADVAGITDGLKTEKEKAEKFIEAIKELNRKMNIPDKFEGIKDEDIELIAKRALKEGNPLYPVPKIMNLEECKAIIKNLQK
ncbi:MAG: iron-containing alcohol dehydrogenase [Ruminococcaceae bacterium]|nr:iron-containing alcohol dehydrogenase [Oscillospiraceae bacterium]